MLKSVVFIGQMDKRVKFYTVEDNYNEVRENKPVETLFKEVWANRQDLKTPNTDSEFVEGKIVHEQKDCFTIRYRKQILDDGAKMVLEYNEKKYRIDHVEEVGRKQHLRVYVNNYE